MTSTSDKTMIEKRFYETLINSEDAGHPVQVLGEMYAKEQKKEMAELSSIRFAQGEIYFHCRDYETAIFKWENILDEKMMWAKKNSGDAYYELGLLAAAEEIYKSIDSENPSLLTEASLQLFSLYIEENRMENATAVIKQIMEVNPDYPNAAEIARTFFEEQQDWGNAVELAAKEGIRSESVHWFELLTSYIDRGITGGGAPEYYSNVLFSLYHLDLNRFEQMAVALWNTYKETDSYFAWLHTINSLFMNVETDSPHIWRELSRCYEEAYLELISGKYLVKEIQGMIPAVLAQWLKVADKKHELAAAAAVLSWNERFAETMEAITIQDAEFKIMNAAEAEDGFEERIQLFQAVAEWAASHGLDVDRRLEWFVSQLADLNERKLLIAGSEQSGKTSVIHSVLQEQILGEAATGAVMVKDGDVFGVREISETEVREREEFLQEEMPIIRGHRETCLEVQLASDFLHRNKLAFIDTPGLIGSSAKNELFSYIHAADGLLFVLDATAPFTDTECEALLQVQKQAPNLPIHFLLNKMDALYSGTEVQKLAEETTVRVRQYFPNARVFPFSAARRSTEQLGDFSQFLNTVFVSRDRKSSRTDQLLYFIRAIVSELFQRRIDAENNLTNLIEWNEQVSTKLNGAIHQVEDLEKEKAKSIKAGFAESKEEVKYDITSKIPEILRGCTELVKEDSDFRNIHVELNKEMNERIQDYVRGTALPKLYRSLQNWIEASSDEFKHSQQFLWDMAEGFNNLFGEQRITLDCDFKVLDDWRRDADRMTNGIHMEEMNILLRHTPSQLLLKGAGKLLGVLPQNNSMLYNSYKKFLENEDYQEQAISFTTKFLRQFEMFEKAIERDVAMFFRNPAQELERTLQQSGEKITEGKAALHEMNINPESYKDPLTLFEVRLRQFEWMNVQ
ncbi:GTP-binding protein [Peribacillus saganii]|uniref:GTP-binding protein n=1 Tax=Peribacillus saganii TaxID=2303992 RepID=A0A372LNB2_9BACI|nr:GTPase domain-containing protein [Peribacillus saganii]RFU69008.1 GTP-binding protein [Peribacillus saganii]